MNQDLKNVRSFIQQAKDLSAGDKDKLLTSIENVGHELQLEESLEKVRASAMNMKATDDLPGICEILYAELLVLGFDEIRNAMINIYDDTDSSFYNYDYSDEIGQSITRLFYNTHPVIEKQVNQIRSSVNAFSETSFHGSELEEWKEFRRSRGEKDDPRLEKVSELHYYFYSLGSASIGISTFRKITEGKLKALRRFRNVFEFAYRRYLDVAEAAAQAREALIELALERVRARTLAMQKSEELLETSSVLFQQLEELGEPADQLTIGIVNEAENVVEISATLRGNILQHTMKAGIDEPIVMSKIADAWRAGQKTLILEIKGRDLETYNGYRNLMVGSQMFPVKVNDDDKRIIQVAFFSKGMLALGTTDPRPRESMQLLERFASVFELTYTRFLDLQKAEAQAREAQIEASLERVRAKAMAMHNSGDLNEAAGAVFTELKKLGIKPIRSGFVLLTTDTRKAKLYPATTFDDENTVSIPGEFEFTGHPVFEKQYESWQCLENYFPVLEGEVLTSYYKILSEGLSVPFESFPTDKTQYGCFLPFAAGFLFTWSAEPHPETDVNILSRFKLILDLTIRRYIDLQASETQARAAQLERKRSEDLLLNILPLEIANELKQFGKSYARKHEQVSILFADIKGFSSISEMLSAEELVNQLDECFRAFDNIVTKHGLEKIKTIGDAYVCACGLPNPDPENAVKTVRAALDMLEFSKGFGMTKKIQNLPAFDFRFGIHTGPVITGVVGLKKFTYDIWGDAVNMAARMEQHGEPGRINISGSTWQLVKEKVRCTHRGKIEAKNKGEVDMYFVEDQL